jgi:addiction module HigA family antidote
LTRGDVEPSASIGLLRITIEEVDVARTPIHPGEHLAEELTELGMSAAELARQIDVPVNRVTEIINGQRSVTADTALRLGHWFGTSPEFWLNLQKLYELRQAQKEIGEDIEKLPRLSDRKPVGGHASRPM